MLRYRWRLVLSLIVVVIAATTGMFVTGEAAASAPSVTGSTALVGAPSALTCGGTVNVRVTLTGTGGITGTATDVMLVLDLSGSISGAKLTALKTAATSFVQALDLGRNRAGIVTYKGSSAATPLPLGSTKNALVNYLSGISGTSGSSPHHLGIGAAQAALTAPGSSNARALALFTDGLTQQSEAQTAAATAKAAPANIRIATVGLGGDAAATAMRAWASDPGYYQSGSSGFDATKLVADVGAAVAVPAAFTLTETPGQHFGLSGAGSSAGPTPGSLQWTGSLADGDGVTFDLTATRDGSPLSSVTEEVVSTSALTGGTITGATKKIDVLPCDSNGLLAPKVTCTGTACGTGGTTPNGVTFSLNAGSPPAGTEVFVAGLTSAPPAGACSGFDGNTNGVQFDIRPLTTPGTFEIKIPKAALGGKKWWQTDVCLGTNLKFITKIGSLSNLRPGAVNSGDRWWGLLPSLPRYVNISGLGLTKGPWITYRAPGASAGDAVIRFTVPYVGANSASFTTNGLPGYDPRAFGG